MTLPKIWNPKTVLQGAEGFHLRNVAESILQGPPRRDIFIDPLSLPIAGLCSLSQGSEYPTLADTPKEILPFSHTPVILIDLDDTVWPQVEYLIRAIGEASGKPITMEEFLKYNHTRKIPAWKDDEKTMVIHDQIVRDEHPVYTSALNPAYEDAIKTIIASERMGHLFSYVTARPNLVFENTKKAILWNQLPLDPSTKNREALSDDIPGSGNLYCITNSQPGISDKSIVAGQWLDHLHERGWQGKMLIIDDLIANYGSVIQEPDVIGIALQGPLNVHKEVFPQEIRVNSWREIGEIIKDIHEEALNLDEKNTREFELHGHVYSFDKRDTGNRSFACCSPQEKATGL